MLKLKRGDVLQNVEIADIAEGGKSVGKKEGLVVFVKGAVPGDTVDVTITKVKRRYYEGNILNLITASTSRIEPVCTHFGICGGCKWQHLNYAQQLYFKQKQVVDNLTRIGKVNPEIINDIIPSAKIYNYRNKLEFTFTNKRWLTADEMGSEITQINGLGFHIPGLFNKVVNVEECHLQNEISNRIRLAVREFTLKNGYSYFDLKEQHGIMRNLIIRTSETGEVMVIVIFHEDDNEKIEALMSHLSTTFGEITSLMYVVNPKRNDTIGDLDVLLYRGKDHLTEIMDGLTFKIGPKSFFQTNSIQALTLYNLVKEMAGLTGTETVYDLYTGTGTIAVFMAPHAHKVVGIEYVEEAIENAKENSALNGQQNTTFVAGVMEKILDDDFINSNSIPDVVITDPPRAGMHAKVVEQLIKLKPQRIVYVSCNPGTQARDIALLSELYNTIRTQPVDMFPHTEHVENVALLELK